MASNQDIIEKIKKVYSKNSNYTPLLIESDKGGQWLLHGENGGLIKDGKFYPVIGSNMFGDTKPTDGEMCHWGKIKNVLNLLSQNWVFEKNGKMRDICHYIGLDGKIHHWIEMENVCSELSDFIHSRLKNPLPYPTEIKQDNSDD